MNKYCIKYFFNIIEIKAVHRHVLLKFIFSFKDLQILREKYWHSRQASECSRSELGKSGFIPLRTLALNLPSPLCRQGKINRPDPPPKKHITINFICAEHAVCAPSHEPLLRMLFTWPWRPVRSALAQ